MSVAPLTNAERDLCSQLRAAKQANLVPGAKWNVVGIKWMRRWSNYVNLEEDARWGSMAHPPPGPVDSGMLLDENGVLKRNMLEDLDYTLIPHELYVSLVDIYGGGPDIARNVVYYSNQKQTCVVDLYPMIYNAYVLDTCAVDGSSGLSELTVPERPSVSIEQSKYTAFDEVKQNLLAALNLTSLPEHFRMWIRKPEYFYASKSSASSKGLVTNSETEVDTPRYLTAAMTDTIPDSWEIMKGDIVYTYEYPGGSVDLLLEILSAPKSDASLAEEDADARRGLLSRWLRDLKEGDVVDGKDINGKWYEAVVCPMPEASEEVDKDPAPAGSIRLHFKAWSSKWDDTVVPDDIPSRIWPLHSKTINWRGSLRAGDFVEFRSSGSKEPTRWEIATVSTVDSQRGFVKIRLESSGVGDFKNLTLQSEELCCHPTHVKSSMRSIAPITSTYASSSRGAGSSSYMSSHRGAGSYMSGGRSHEEGALQAGGAPGVVGLRNLGNTCFMNSMLQCLSHAKPLTDVFLSDEYLGQINKTNVLGMGGKIATVYGSLLKDMWAQRYSVVNPYEFKDTIGQFQPQFAGYQQQDSQEFMLFLLDGLHEDMNRIDKKPFVEKIESNGRPDSLISREAWRRFLLRNDSEIVDKMFGQLRSHVTCRNCGYQSVTFDEFNSLPLPIPVKSTRRVPLTLVPLPLGSTPIIIVLEVEMTSSIGDLKKAIIAKYQSVLTSALRRSRKREYQQTIGDSANDTNAMDTDSIASEPYVLVGNGDETPTEDSDEPTKTADVDSSLNTSACWSEHTGDIHLHFANYATYSKKITNNYKEETPVQDLMKHYSSTSQLYVFQLEHAAPISEYSEYGSVASNRYSTYLTPDEAPNQEVKARFVDIVMMKSPRSAVNKLTTSPFYPTYNSRYPSLLGPSYRLSYELGVTKHRELYETVEKLALSLLPPNSPYADFSRKLKSTNSSQDSEDGQNAPFKLQYSNIYGTDGDADFPFDSDDTINETLRKNTLICMWTDDALAPVHVNEQNQDSYDADSPSSTPVTVQNMLFQRRKFVSGALSYPFVVDHEFVPGDEKDIVGSSEKKSIDIKVCLDKFIEREIMPEEETWYCPSCKEHKSPIKKFDLWATPEILIVQLKRFQYIPGSFFIHREKIDDLVEFPIEGLDLTEYVRGEQAVEHPPIYDLFAVSEHSGGLGGGHYTAVAKTPDTDDWVNYNDSHCSKADGSNIVTPCAYMLFYKKRGTGVKWAGVLPLEHGIEDSKE